MPNASTAILLFSRSASAEAAQKSFGAGSIGDSRITAGLIERTASTLIKTDLPIFRSTEENQIGVTFGQRLSDAMAKVFADGFENVIVVGNDCPSIRPGHLRSAAELLESGKNVLGPDRRGGVWMIGLQKAHFNAEVLASLRWETGELYDDLAAHFPEVTDFARLGDLNSFEDLRQNWFFLRRQLSELFDLLLLSEAAFGLPDGQPEPVAVTRRLGRAPPMG